ncbi:DUF4398 domain-containing protein [Halomonas denitrificans]|nr:DUF4398 domain-containing protein [Halomonas denitrificans]
MPNDPMMSVLARSGAVVLLGLALAGCATTPPDPALLRPAEDALALAEQAGARSRAPLELEEARGYYENATEALAAEEPSAVARWVELAEVQARLAIVRSQGAEARDRLAERRSEYEALRDELIDVFGDELQLEDTP